MLPKIISLGYVVPEYSYSQEEIFRSLSYPHHFWRIFRDAGITKRHFCIPLERIKTLSFQEQEEEYLRSAVSLSKEAVRNCLDGRDPKEISCLVYCSCTGAVPGPTSGDYLMKELNLLPSTRVININFQGCEGGGFPGLSTAIDFVVGHKKLALVIATELCGLTYYPEPDGKPDPQNDYQCLRANAIFGEASSAALVGYDNDWRHPRIIDQESYTDTRYIDDLGYRWQEGRLMVLLSKRVPEIAPVVVKAAVDALLQRQGLKVADIHWYLTHAAGVSVLRNIQNVLGFPEEKLKLSFGVLRDFGNVSSATVGIIGKRLMSENIGKGERILVITVGPGIRAGVSLLQFSVGK